MRAHELTLPTSLHTLQGGQTMTPDLPSQRRIPWKRFLIPVGVSIMTLIGLGIGVDGETPYPPLTPG